jgi:prepilin-type N-terminal cleavage/methylation domain-containing protein
MVGMSRTRVGFTLIELLVVIAIIAILAAILFPVFARAKAKAQQNNCLSNVKQLTLAFLMYASDNDDYAPLAQGNPNFGDNKSGRLWATSIYPYVKNLQIYACPSAGGTGMVTAGDNVVPGTTSPILDYVMNDSFGSPAITLAQVNNVSGCLLVLEGLSRHECEQRVES